MYIQSYEVKKPGPENLALSWPQGNGSRLRAQGVRCQERKTKKLEPPQELAIFTDRAV
jgi:hypothetical protein